MDAYIQNYQIEKVDTKVVNSSNSFNIQFSTQVRNHLKIIHCNISSIGKNFDNLCLFLSTLEVEFDVIILTETHIQENIAHAPYTLKNYDLLYNKGNLNKNDGVIVYIKSTMDYQYSIVSLGNINGLEIVINNKNNKIYLTAIYKSPTVNENSFNQSLHEYLVSKKKINFHILVGDININLFADSDYVEEYQNLLAALNFVPYINEVTRPKTQTCIDHFFIKCPSNKNYNISSFIFENNSISDHYPIAISIPSNMNNINKSENITKKHINYNSLKADLKKETWLDVYSETDKNKAVSLFINKIINLVNKNTVSIKNKNNKTKGNFKKEWMTNGLLNSINEKHRLYKQVIQNPTDTNLKTRYNNYKNYLRFLIRVQKKTICPK